MLYSVIPTPALSALSPRNSKNRLFFGAYCRRFIVLDPIPTNLNTNTCCSAAVYSMMTADCNFHFDQKARSCSGGAGRSRLGFAAGGERWCRWTRNHIFVAGRSANFGILCCGGGGCLGGSCLRLEVLGRHVIASGKSRLPSWQPLHPYRGVGFLSKVAVRIDRPSCCRSSGRHPNTWTWAPKGRSCSWGRGIDGPWRAGRAPLLFLRRSCRFCLWLCRIVAWLGRGRWRWSPSSFS